MSSSNHSFQDAQLGSDLVLLCNFNGVPTPTVQWLHNGTTLSNGDDGVNITSGNISILQVRNLKRSSGGVYSCKGSNIIGFNTLEFRINLQSWVLTVIVFNKYTSVYVLSGCVYMHYCVLHMSWDAVPSWSSLCILIYISIQHHQNL